MKTPMILLTSIISLAHTISANAAVDMPVPTTNPFTQCWVESGPQLEKDALKIPNEILDASFADLNKKNPNSPKSFSVSFNLNYENETRELSLSENQEFKDMAEKDSDVIVQIGGYNGEIYGAIDTKFGSAYTRTEATEPVRGFQRASVYLQYVSYATGRYADLRLHCEYRQVTN